MDITLTLCDKKLIGDIPVYEFKNVEHSKNLNEAFKIFNLWLNTKNLNKSVFVCFESIRDLPNKELRDEQQSFLVSHNWGHITDFCEARLSGWNYYNVDFAVFEFNNYKEAFEYCKDLRESF